MCSTNATIFQAQFLPFRGMLMLVEVLESEDISTISLGRLLSWIWAGSYESAFFCCGLRIRYGGFYLRLVGGEEFRSLRLKSHDQNRLGVGCAD
jgi:hypothetical protein